MTKTKKKRKLIQIIFIIYMLFVFYLTLMPNTAFITYEITYNIIPFNSITNYIIDMNNHGFIYLDNLIIYFPDFIKMIQMLFSTTFINFIGNIILFIPLGFLFPYAFDKKISILKILLVGCIVSFGIEITQYLVLSSRRADIDDIILNVFGVLIGFLIYKWIEK
jgi:glycopeptide antibiotics resistance protein